MTNRPLLQVHRRGHRQLNRLLASVHKVESPGSDLLFGVNATSPKLLFFAQRLRECSVATESFTKLKLKIPPKRNINATEKRTLHGPGRDSRHRRAHRARR